jgi:hypothetical protein
LAGEFPVIMPQSLRVAETIKEIHTRETKKQTAVLIRQLQCKPSPLSAGFIAAPFDADTGCFTGN